MEKRFDKGGSFTIAVVVMVIILILAMTLAAVLFLPVKSFNFDKTKSLASSDGVDKLELKLNVDVGEVRVTFTKLTNISLSMHVVGKGSVGILTNIDGLTFDFVTSTSADTAIVNASVNVKDRLLGSSNLNLRCDVLIDESMRSKLILHTTVGSTSVDTTNASSMDEIQLVTKTGSVSLVIVKGVELHGNIEMATNIGGVQLRWDDPSVKENINVVAEARTGGVDLRFNQSEKMNKDVKVDGITKTGGVSLFMNLVGNVGAGINSTTDLGKVNIGSKVGFTGSDNALRSSNYPSDGNFGVVLNAVVGGIEVNASSKASG